jgi:type II secretory pathway predicted ATPase ExeA
VRVVHVAEVADPRGLAQAAQDRPSRPAEMPDMTLAETTGYLAHHLKLAGRSDTLFSDDAVALIHQVSRGLPRAVNNLALQALVAAFAADKAVVDESSARAAVTEVTTE